VSILSGPGVLQQMQLTRDAKSMQREADRLGRVLERKEQAYRLADRLHRAKNAAVERALKSKKGKEKGALHPVRAMYKDYAALSDYYVATLKMRRAEQLYALAQNAAHEEHIAMLQLKVHRMCRLLRVSRKHKKRTIGSPSARFKFSPRKSFWMFLICTFSPPCHYLGGLVCRCRPKY
jgi:hypothetical protein